MTETNMVPDSEKMSESERMHAAKLKLGNEVIPEIYDDMKESYGTVSFEEFIAKVDKFTRTNANLAAVIEMERMASSAPERNEAYDRERMLKELQNNIPSAQGWGEPNRPELV